MPPAIAFGSLVSSADINPPGVASIVLGDRIFPVNDLFVVGFPVHLNGDLEVFSCSGFEMHATDHERRKSTEVMMITDDQVGVMRRDFSIELD